MSLKQAIVPATDSVLTQSIHSIERSRGITSITKHKSNEFDQLTDTHSDYLSRVVLFRIPTFDTGDDPEAKRGRI